MNIANWIAINQKKLIDINIKSARLDIELILSSVLKKPRTFIHAHPEYTLNTQQLEMLGLYIDQRLKRMPIAYILNYKEFFGLSFYVNENVLIPRMETEDLVTFALNHLKKFSNQKNIVDVGCGSGCIGIATKLNSKNTNVCLIDISKKALKVASKNSTTLNASVKIIRNDLLTNWSEKTDIIVANLPYVPNNMPCSPEVVFEPKKAVFAKDNGLFLIKKLIKQSREILPKNGALILECDSSQIKEVIKIAKLNNFWLQNKTNFGLYFIYKPLVQ